MEIGLRKLLGNPEDPPEGETPREILRSRKIQGVCNNAAGIYEWGKCSPQTSPLIDNNSGKEVGRALVFSRELWGSTTPTIDISGEEFWVQSHETNPHTLTVRSCNDPESVLLKEPGWRQKLANAIMRACQNPAKYADYELGGRRSTIK